MENDKVFLYISTSDRKRKGEHPILGKDMLKIWKEEIEKILPENALPVYGGSPVRHVYEFLEDFEADYTVHGYRGRSCTVYSDPEDTTLNYSMENRTTYFPKAYSAGTVKFAAEDNPEAYTRGKGMPDISGTSMRKALQAGDIETFTLGIPPEVNAQHVFETLQGQKTPSVLYDYIKALVTD